MLKKLTTAGTLLVTILIADILTKRWALESLSHGYTLESFGVPLTLAFNKGIAFGIGIPDMGRWIVVGASIFVMIVLAGMLRDARQNDHARIFAIGLVWAGALGNLIDRVRWDAGVVDFIGPIDLGFMHWPIFNVADMAITTGAILLGMSLWREDTANGAAPATQTLDSDQATS
ncbi:MAG: signal peptidase II [Longimicrobiales bacterium]